MLPKSDQNCPMDSILKLLMGPWTVYIVWFLHVRGELRFGELKRILDGVSSKILTERLRMLEDAGLIYRNYESTVPPKVSYGLTERGKQLTPTLDSLNALAIQWIREDESVTVQPFEAAI
jgi:DNA-binding HxlR family transcriptional regulator